jgi:hypothetical protein
MPNSVGHLSLWYPTARSEVTQKLFLYKDGRKQNFTVIDLHFQGKIILWTGFGR